MFLRQSGRYPDRLGDLQPVHEVAGRGPEEGARLKSAGPARGRHHHPKEGEIQMKLQDWCEENGVAPRWLESENRSARVPLRHPIPPGPTVGEGYADIGLWHLEDYRIVGFGRSGDGSRTS